MSGLLVNIDTGRPFTIFEACPDSRCHEVPASHFVCPGCQGRRGRQQAFDTVEEVREYLRTLPHAARPSWSTPASGATSPDRPPAPTGAARAHPVAFDARKRFMMFEACREEHGEGAQAVEVPCPKCKGTRGVGTEYDTADEMLQHVTPGVV